VSSGGFIIGIEGVDAVGKQTQTLLLKKWLRRNGFACVGMSFPDYGTPIGKEIAAFLSAERNFPPQVRHMLFAANRWEKLTVIKRYQNEGKVINVNRYTESNLVYGMAYGLPIKWLSALEDGIPKTNMVLVLNAPPKQLASRRWDKDSYEKDQDLQQRASALYKELARRFGWGVIDATKNVEEIHDSIIGLVKHQLLRRGSRTH